MTLLICDEIDLIEPHLDYHFSRGVDFAVITTNRAPDAAIEKIGPYVERGLAQLIRQDVDVYAQHEWVTRMARLAVTEHGADWVINADPDEFYWPDRGSLKDVLGAVPDEYGVLEVPVVHFLPPRTHGNFFADDMTVRQVRSVKPSGRALFAKAFHRGVPDVEVSMGNHRVDGTGLEPIPGWEPVLGLHYPLRSYEQFEHRVTTGLLSDPNRMLVRYGQRVEQEDLGNLRVAYNRAALDEEKVSEGIRTGYLVVDERLKRFFRTRPGRFDHSGAPDTALVEDLRAEARRAVIAHQCHPLYLIAEENRRKAEQLHAKTLRLVGKLERRDRRLSAIKEKSKRARRRADTAKLRRDALKDELARLQTSWYVQLGSRLDSLISRCIRASASVSGDRKPRPDA